MPLPTGLFKVLSAEGTPCNGGSGKWFLPTKTKPGKWMPKISGVCVCSRGYHLTSAPLEWFGSGPRRLFVAAPAPNADIDYDNAGGAKVAVSSARLLEEVTPKW